MKRKIKGKYISSTSKRYELDEENLMIEFAKCLDICIRDSKLVYKLKQGEHCKNLYDFLRTTELFPLYISYARTVYERLGKKTNKCKD